MHAQTHLLAGRRVLVTGASSGIGLATARAATAAGARVALVARSEDRLAAVSAELPGSVACPADVADPDQAELAVERAISHMNGLDAIVNSAGSYFQGSPSGTDPRDWRYLMNVNIAGILNIIHPAMDELRAASGPSIVNVSSMAGRRVGTAYSGIYSATKAAVHSLGDALRMELSRDGIRVTTFAPGAVDTKMFNQWDNLKPLASASLSASHAADSIVHLLALPPEVLVVEYAVVATTNLGPDPNAALLIDDRGAEVVGGNS